MMGYPILISEMRNMNIEAGIHRRMKSARITIILKGKHHFLDCEVRSSLSAGRIRVEIFSFRRAKTKVRRDGSQTDKQAHRTYNV